MISFPSTLFVDLHVPPLCTKSLTSSLDCSLFSLHFGAKMTERGIAEIKWSQ